MARVELKNVSKVYKGSDSPAVDGVSIEAKDREFLVLVGPSGCGKSTTLRMVAGLEDPTSGDIFIADGRVNNVAPKDRDIAMIFQNYALYPHMTVYQNMGFGLKMRKFPKPEIDKRVREAAETLGLTELLERKPKALSGGQRQRVAVGRAIVRDPAVFLFDEPLSNLDAKMRIAMRKEIRRLHRDLEATMIYVTHDQVEAMTMGDRIVVMNDGRVQQIDEPKVLYDRPQNAFVAGFIGSPPMNLVRGHIAASGGFLKFSSGSLKFQLGTEFSAGLKDRDGKEVLFGLRPEDIHETQSGSESENFALIELEIENVEPLGSELIVMGRRGDSELTARLGADSQVNYGETKTFHLNLAKAHFFDPQTGLRLV